MSRSLFRGCPFIRGFNNTYTVYNIDNLIKRLRFRLAFKKYSESNTTEKQLFNKILTRNSCEQEKKSFLSIL